MSFNIPTLAQVAERARQAFKVNLPASDPWLPNNNIYVSAKVIAEQVWESFHRIDFVKNQAFPLTATGEYLDLHAQQYGLTRKSALLATGSLLGTGGTAATVIPVGTLLQRADGTQYITTEATTLDALGNGTFYADAVEAGVDGNYAQGGEIFFLAVVAGQPTQLLVSSSTLDGGSPTESDEDLRARLLQRLQFPPHAGSKSDFERWTLEVPGVTRVWVSGAAFGPGTVGVYFMMDDSYADGIPLAVDVATVQAYLDALAPITAAVLVFAPVAEPVNIEIVDLNDYSSATVAKIQDELEAMFRAKSSVSTPSEVNYIRLSWIYQAVSQATGEVYHNIQAPSQDVAITVGKIAVYNSNYISISG